MCWHLITESWLKNNGMSYMCNTPSCFDCTDRPWWGPLRPLHFSTTKMTLNLTYPVWISLFLRSHTLELITQFPTHMSSSSRSVSKKSHARFMAPGHFINIGKWKWKKGKSHGRVECKPCDFRRTVLFIWETWFFPSDGVSACVCLGDPGVGRVLNRTSESDKRVLTVRGAEPGGLSQWLRT